MTTTIPAIPIPTIALTTGNRPAVRSRNDDVRAVPAALKSEWIKMASLRANKVVLALTPVIGALIAWALACSDTHKKLTASELFIFPLPLVAMLTAVTAILMFTSEAQHGTLAAALTARPTRWVIVSAKAVMATTVGLVLGGAAMAAGFCGALLGGAAVGDGSAIVSRAAWALLYISLAAMIGLGVGMIARHSAGAITGLLMWSFVIESLFAPALPEGVRHFLPFSAGYRLLDAGPSFKAPVAIAHELARPQYALIFGLYALASLVGGTLLLYRRDNN